MAYPFDSDVTVNPSTLTTSTTQTAPAYFLDIMSGPVAATTSILTPTLIIPLTITPDTLAAIATIQDVSLMMPVVNGTIVVGSGTIGSQYIATRYPVEDGLTAGTTTQQGTYKYPNLEATEEGTW